MENDGLDLGPGERAALVDAVCADSPVVVVTGHYGVGKTNLALNLALACASRGEAVALADLDLVNPYFRSSDLRAELERAGVRLVAPRFAGTTLDTPSVTGELDCAIDEAARGWADGAAAAGDGGAAGARRTRLIIDVGGDDAGATALGRYSDELRALEPGALRMLYVVNAFRNLTQAPGEAAAVLGEIEAVSRMRATGVVNNSHLCEETERNDIETGRKWARNTALECGLPLVATCVPAHVIECCNSEEGPDEPLVRVARYVRTPWQ